MKPTCVTDQVYNAVVTAARDTFTVKDRITKHAIEDYASMNYDRMAADRLNKITPGYMNEDRD
jgi:hypothetical protein